VLIAVVALSFVLTPSFAGADIYRFVDREGVEHYTNVQPRGAGWRRVINEDTREVLGRMSRKPAHPNDPTRMSRYDGHIREAAALYQLPEAFVRAVVQVESNFYFDVVSHTGAMGLMQLMPGTASSMGVTDAFDPRQNIFGGTRFLRVLANDFNGDLVLTIAAYNAGKGAVLKYGGLPPYAETRGYVKKVLSYYYAFRAGVSSSPRSIAAGG
jgi:soluble lytic murein transglycosylase-like protein